MTADSSASGTMRFNFLTYANRSGSTVFARRLTASAPSLLVIPEFRLPGILLAYGNEAIVEMSAAHLHEVLSLDAQLVESLRFSPEEVKALAHENAGKGIRPLVEDIARRYAVSVGSTATTVLLKGSLAVRYPHLINELFPEARVLSIVRDGRAVANSMLRTPVLWHSSEKMGRGDIYYCARHWQDALAHSKELATDLLYLELRFEGLLADEAGLMKQVCSFLDVPYEAESPEAVSFEVSEREQRIHPLLSEDLVQDREKAWQHELKRWQGIAMETMAAQTLESYGYEPYFSVGASKAGRAAAMARALAVHAVMTPRWALKRLWALRNRRRYVFVAARTALRRSRNR